MNENQLYQFLAENEISHQRFEHPAVYTVDQANFYLKSAPGARTKNLFLRHEKKEIHYLVWTRDDKRLDLKRFGKIMGMGNPRFGSPENMMLYLGIEPGSVSVLGLVNDIHHQVQLLIDRELWVSESFQCHPLINTATIVLSKADIEKIFKLTGHTYQIVDIPEKASS
jgi:Ala-tRNA(Pro) deacylase